MSIRLVTIIGTRPEIIKMSRLIPLLDKGFDHNLVYTNQHYSEDMCGVFFKELGVRKPDFFLNTNSSDVANLTNDIRKKLQDLQPDYTIVYGDTNSSLAAARAAKSVGSKIIHIEAGLRCYDERVPEEINRIEIDKISDYYFTPTELVKGFLKKEGIVNNIHVVGNTVVDACLNYLPKAGKSNIIERLGLSNNFILFTAHRQENVDNLSRLSRIIEIFSRISLPVVYPIHPRTKTMLKQFNLKLPDHVLTIDPVGYLDFLKLLKECSLVLTDSGGVQEEAITLKTPCLTIRESTERWETILSGGNFLVGIEPRLVSYKTKFVLETDMKDRIKNIKNPYGIGDTSKQICDILTKKILI